jgi:hypothetical protein
MPHLRQISCTPTVGTCSSPSHHRACLCFSFQSSLKLVCLVPHHCKIVVAPACRCSSSLRVLHSPCWHLARQLDFATISCSRLLAQSLSLIDSQLRILVYRIDTVTDLYRYIRGPQISVAATRPTFHQRHLQLHCSVLYRQLRLSI